MAITKMQEKFLQQQDELRGRINTEDTFDINSIKFIAGVDLAYWQKNDEEYKPTIFVSGKTVFYKGECWTCDEISCVKCTKWFERVEVYSNGKKVLSFPWELDNSELFIAWVNKCGITFEDYRMKNFQ